jgi:hypothetical protein
MRVRYQAALTKLRPHLVLVEFGESFLAFRNINSRIGVALSNHRWELQYDIPSPLASGQRFFAPVN